MKTIPLKFKIMLVASPAIILLDQWTKWIVLGHFYLGESISIFHDFFNLTYVQNTGAAFGFLAKSHPAFRVPFFIIVPFVALFVIGSIFKKIPPKSRFVSTALAFVVGGAIGNLIDRIRHGFVVDFLDFHYKSQHHFPAFNVADSAICVGVAMLLIDMLLNPEQQSGRK